MSINYEWKVHIIQKMWPQNKIRGTEASVQKKIVQKLISQVRATLKLIGNP